jgi:DNA-binding protein
MTEEQTTENKEENKQEDKSEKSNLENSQTIAQKENSENIVFIGSKPLVNYVRGVIMQFKRNGSDEVIIRSRGKFISKAVDVAEIARRSLEEDKISIKDIKISSESFEAKGKKTNISTMDIFMGC